MMMRTLAFSTQVALGAAQRLRAKDFLQHIIFVFLPFKVLFKLTLNFRHYTRRGDLDNHLKFFCATKVADHFPWVLSEQFTKNLPNECFFYLLFLGYEEKAFARFPNLDWEHCEDFLLDEITQFFETHTSGYSMGLLAQIHAIGWTSLESRITPEMSTFVIRMLEHRNFSYEENIYGGRIEFGEDDLTEAPLEIYIPQFFQDKELIDALMTELNLGGYDNILRLRDAAAGQRWESFPADHRNRRMLGDIALFYAYRHLLLRTYHNGEGHYVSVLHQRSLEVQRRLCRSLPAPSRKLGRLLDERGINLREVRLLSPDWSALIGHNGHLNVHLMMQKMGWWHGAPVVLAYKDRIANRTFLSLFDELCPLMTLGENTDADVWHELASLTPFLGVSHQAFAFEDGRAMYWNDAGAMALEQWEAEGRGFPLREIYDRRLLADDQPEILLQTLRKKWGMRPDDWYVCLHLREARARGEKDGIGESVRNAAFENYLDAIRHITDMGGWVVRMGSPKAAPLPELPRLIDYARSPDQLPVMDIHLVRRARMFIGTTSGFAYVASSFGIPTAMVNAISSVGLLWSKDTRFALKPIRTTDDRLLSLNDITSERWRWAFPTHESMARAGLIAEDSSSDEILETVREVLEISDPTYQEPPDSGDTWKKCLNIPSFFGSSRPSKYFLEKYSSQLLSTERAKVTVGGS